MSRASKSMLGCGIYLVVLGILLLFFPEFVLAGIGLFSPPDIMSRMCGMIFLIFSYIYIRTGIKDEGMEFFLSSYCSRKMHHPNIFNGILSVRLW